MKGTYINIHFDADSFFSSSGVSISCQISESEDIKMIIGLNIWNWHQYSDIDVDCYFGCGSCFSKLPDIDIFRIGEQCTAAIKAACLTTDAIGDEEGNGIKFWRV